MERKVQVVFQVPLKEDAEAGNGEEHPPFRWRLLQDQMTKLFDGWTEQPGWTGEWARPGTGEIVNEPSRVFQIDAKENSLDDAKGFLRRVCVTFGQECIRAIILGYAEYIEGGPDDEHL